MRSKEGGCYSCDDYIDRIYTNCSVCPNRIAEGYGDCLFVDGRKLHYERRTENQAEEEWEEKQAGVLPLENDECPTGYPVRRWDDLCYSCDFKNCIQIDSIYNLNFPDKPACPQRVIYKIGAGNPSSCLWKNGNKPLIDKVFSYHRCDVVYDVNLQFNEEKCRKYFPEKRYVAGNWCILCNKDVSTYNNASSCISCDGFWDKNKCRKRMLADVVHVCEQNSDCKKGEFCYFNQCTQVPKHQEDWVCMPYKGGDVFSLYNLCQATGMRFPTEREVIDNQNQLRKVCQDDDFAVYWQNEKEWSREINALPKYGYLITQNKDYLTDLMMGSSGEESLRLICHKKKLVL